MFDSFEKYSGMWNPLTLEEFLEIHEGMLKSSEGDEDAAEILEELLQAAFTYADIRAKWSLMSREEKMEIDETRTMKHDALIVKFNKLARYQKMQGRDISWRERLGYTEDEPANRRRIGDFACWLAFTAGICAR